MGKGDPPNPPARFARGSRHEIGHGERTSARFSGKVEIIPAPPPPGDLARRVSLLERRLIAIERRQSAIERQVEGQAPPADGDDDGGEGLPR